MRRDPSVASNIKAIQEATAIRCRKQLRGTLSTQSSMESVQALKELAPR